MILGLVLVWAIGALVAACCWAATIGLDNYEGGKVSLPACLSMAFVVGVAWPAWLAIALLCDRVDVTRGDR